MADAGGQVQEIVLLHGHLLAGVQQGTAALLDEVHLLLAGVADHGRGAAWRDREFAVTGDGLELAGIRIADPEQGLVGSLRGIRGEIVRLRADIRYLTAQEDGVRREQASRGGENESQSNECQSVEAAHKSSTSGRRLAAPA